MDETGEAGGGSNSSCHGNSLPTKPQAPVVDRRQISCIESFSGRCRCGSARGGVKGLGDTSNAILSHYTFHATPSPLCLAVTTVTKVLPPPFHPACQPNPKPPLWIGNSYKGFEYTERYEDYDNYNSNDNDAPWYDCENSGDD